MNEGQNQSGLDHLPPMLTLSEAASILRIGRSTAYEEANSYEATDGRTGIPVIRIGRLFRVPRWALAYYVLHGRPPGRDTLGTGDS